MSFFTCSRLDEVYPHFPSEQEVTHFILSSGDLQQYCKGGKLRFLARFILEQPQLHTGGILLPDLVNLYQWLHKDIAHLLTRDHASSITIGQVIDFAEKKLGKEQGKHIRKLYDRVKLNYNQYIELTGGAIGIKPYATSRVNNISDDLPLLNFLTDTGNKTLTSLST